MKYLLYLLLVPISALADECSKVNSCNYSSMWSGFSKFEVTYSDSKENDGTTFEYFIGENESLMTFETRNGKAKIFSIPGVATLWKGIDESGIKNSQECRSIVKDTYAIIQSYAVRPLFFLGYGVKGGPEIVETEKVIDISSNEDTRVQINPGDHMIIGGPWILAGTVSKKEDIRFSIAHEFVGKNGKKSNLYLEGIWDEKRHDIPVRDIEPLDDWLVCMSGRSSYENGKYVFTPNFSNTTGLENVGDLKALTMPSNRNQ